ncbi:MAG TPA: sigma-70 family RNA polymerase sigma factor [Solirubrobacteraceae bacterium]|jgi:RNA polymerase sigma-70 factor (ECF subfamily)|nr:sigma-70 family RNA polymerase sigma factor [Solirubrobacteraceae bacterium]
MALADEKARTADAKESASGVATSNAADRADAARVSHAVRRAQAGDREAFAFLYARYADNIHGYVRSIVHDHHDAEDITQHVFAKLFAVIDKYQERDVPFFAWMLRVARNVAVDHIRRQRLVPVEEVRATEGFGGFGLNATATHRGDLMEALATLPKAQRDVLVMRHVVGLSPTEIATHTGKTEGSIHGLHHRGRRALKAELVARELAPAINTAAVHA